MQRSNRVDIYADTDDTGVIGANIEPFAGDVAREYAKQAKASAEAALASENASDESEAAAKASENAAAVSEAAAKASEEAAAASEQAAKISETNAKASETAAAASAKDAHDVAESIGNPVTDVTEVNGKVTVTKSNGEKNEFFAGLNMLQRNKAYAVGDIAYSPNLPSWAYLECTAAGTTGGTEPSFGYITGGSTVADGTTSWIVRDTRKDGADIAALKNEIDSLKSTIAIIKTDISDANNFTIIYPNGGTSSHPASVSANKRYVEKNPFPGYMVMCYPQIKVNNKWGYSGWYEGDSYGAMGVKANLLLPDDKVIVQTGKLYCLAPSHGSGSPFGNTDNLSSAPCRVLVYKLGKIT